MAVLADDVRDRAFERLYEGHVGDVYRYVLAVLRNPADAEDVTQTTFMNAYRAFKAGERPHKPQNWLIKIAHNACRTRAIRASRRPREVPLDDVVAQLAVSEQEKPNIRELLRALGRLPFNQRAAITMRELEGRSYDEIADTLGVTVPAVEALLVRARRTMRLQSSALRGFAAVQLPRSLRGMFDTGDAVTAGGAVIGGGVLAKAAAVVVAGVVAGGVGKAVDAGIVHRSHSAPRLEPRAHTNPIAASYGSPGAGSASSAAASPRDAGASRRVTPAPVAAPPAPGGLPAPVPAAVTPATPATPAPRPIDGGAVSAAAAPAADGAVAAPTPPGTPRDRGRAREHPVGPARRTIPVHPSRLPVPPLPKAPLPEAPLPEPPSGPLPGPASGPLPAPAPVSPAVPPVPSVPAVAPVPSVPPVPSVSTVPSVPAPPLP
jgi:RNA polymerase sigma factor (sigma-70 family)